MSMDDWKAKAKAFQDVHPQHCGICGLPRTHCYHLDARYREEIDKCRTGLKLDFHVAAEVQDRWYLSALNRLGMEQAKLLPEPPKARFGKLLRSWLQDQRAIPTWYERLCLES